MSSVHTIHIPVMGTGFSIDTPLKVARYGISSVMSLVDDCLIEEMRQHHCQLSKEPYVPIHKHEYDYRARRITAYLNLIDRLVKRQFEELKVSPFEEGSEITKYFRLLPDESPLKSMYLEMLRTSDEAEKHRLQEILRLKLQPGDINVNIMTKLDKANYTPDGHELPPEFSDALSALRGYALSTLSSGIVFSAGINRRLYSYVEEFPDFFADEKGFIKKKIILKVSDFRSAIVQGKFFAKKGLWVSEYRMESGLNCGGHTFITDGYLMGPILEEFKQKRQGLLQELHQILNEALRAKKRPLFDKQLPVKITAQGGIGTTQENRFLLEYYQLDGTGWATPFLLVPEVTNVDPVTLKRLSAAREEDLYLSDVSPLGIPFNNLRGAESDLERDRRIARNRPGSPCPKGYLVSNTEFTKKPICTASRQYQKLKLAELARLNLDRPNFLKRFVEITQKSCVCNDLAEGPLIKNKIGNGRPRFAAVCPGPNIAYFSKIFTLIEMFDHIHGRINLLNETYRPHMFIKELGLNVEYFMKEVHKCLEGCTGKQRQYLNEFKKNLFAGIAYYRELFPKMIHETLEARHKMLEELMRFRKKLVDFVNKASPILSETCQPEPVGEKQFTSPGLLSVQHS